MDRNTWKKDGELFSIPVATGVVIYAGHLVCVNATGFAVPGGPDVTLTTVGIADEMIDNSIGADGAEAILVRRNKSFCMANSTATPVTQALTGQPCYVADSVTVSALVGAPDAPTVPVAGKVLEVTPDGVWVLI